MSIKVSVIIPVYNMECYLERCLLSCMNQLLQDIEIIVVNDGSKDRSLAITKEYAGKDSRIVIIDQENKGVVYARKAGVEKAQGKYVFYLDGDDYIPDNSLDLLYSLAEQHKAEYVAGSMARVRGDKISKAKSSKGFMLLSGSGLLNRIYHHFWELCGRLILRSIFDDLLYRPLAIGEDLFMNMQIAPKVNRGVIVSDCVYYYVRHEDSASMSVNKENSFDINMKLFEHVTSLLDNPCYGKENRAGAYLVFTHFFCDSAYCRKEDVIPLLKKYYWDNVEMKTALWKYQKRYYVAIAGIMIHPLPGMLIMKLINTLYWLRRLI